MGPRPANCKGNPQAGQFADGASGRYSIVTVIGADITGGSCGMWL